MCQDKGGNLISFHSLQEHKVVNVKGGSLWIGLKDVAGDNKDWQWSDNTPFSWNYWDKDAGEPSNNNEKCVVVYNGKWHDYDCSKNAQFMCKSGKFL